MGGGIAIITLAHFRTLYSRVSQAPPFKPQTVAADMSRPITADEINSSSARTVTELVRQLRPQWLRSRGTDVLRPNVDPTEAHGVRVYLNDGLLGGLDALDQVSIDAVTRVEFFDVGPAVLRWGAGNEDGAILLTTRSTE